MALAKKEPGKLQLRQRQLVEPHGRRTVQQMADIKLLHVPYKSNTLAVTDLLGGQIDMMITDTATGLPQVKAGKLRALGISSAARSPLAPEVPTIAEAGVKGYEMGYWFAAYAPAKTPPAVVKRLNELLVKAAKSEPQRHFLRTHRHRGVHHLARRAGEVPDGRVAEVGPHRQGRRHRSRVAASSSPLQ
jgi:tripartite-type tricarboxylate transporter receptor subunit TctC